jgi:hypothetical protein
MPSKLIHVRKIRQTVSDKSRVNMTISNPLKAKERDNYLLEIEAPTSNRKNTKKSRVKGGFSLARKAMTVSLLALIFGGTLAGGMVLNTGTASETASADADIFDPPSILCVMKDDAQAYLGGSNSVVKSGWTQEKGGDPSKAIVPITSGPKNADGSPGARWTALEQYGYFAPTYSTWQGMYVGDEEDEWPYIGTGGGGKLDSYGSIVVIENAKNSPMFSQNMFDCPGTWNAINTSIANAISFLPKMAIGISGEVYQIANTVTLSDEDSKLKPIADAVEQMIVGGGGQKGLKDVLFLDFLTPIIMLGAVSLFYTGIVKRSSLQAGQAALWMIGAAIAGIIFLTNPLLVPKVIDDVAGKVNVAVASAIGQGDNSNEYCTADGGDAETKASRQIKCTVWYTSIYVPWVSGQFGVSQYDIDSNKSMTTDPNVASGKSHTGTKDDLDGEGFTADGIDPASPNASRGAFSNADIKFGAYKVKPATRNWALFQMDAQHNSYVANKGLNYSEIAYNRLVINDNTEWKGADNAIGASLVTAIGSFGPVWVLAGISLALIAYQITMLFLIAFSPVFFLVGVAPGWGRRVAMRWFELVVGLLVKRIVLGMFLLLYLKMYSLIAAQIGMGWFLQIILLTVLSVVAMTQRGKIMDMFTNAIDFGGNKNLDADGGVGKYVAGAATAAAIRGNRMAKAGTVKAGTAAMGATGVAARGTQGVMKERALNRKDNKLTKTKDPMLGIGGTNDLRAANKVKTIKDMDMSRLNTHERSQVLDKSGNIDDKRAAAWLATTKKKQADESAGINKESIELKAREKNINLLPFKERALERKKIRDAREANRNRQAQLNSNVRRLFGEAQGSNVDYSGKAYKPRGPLATQYKSPINPKTRKNPKGK